METRERYFFFSAIYETGGGRIAACNGTASRDDMPTAQAFEALVQEKYPDASKITVMAVSEWDKVDWLALQGIPVEASPTKNGMCSCGEGWQEPPHQCPFKSDVHNDSETLCTCCTGCQYKCAQDI